MSTIQNTQHYIDLFQNRLMHMIEHWRMHEAVQQVEYKYLDRERKLALKAISLGLDFEPAWPTVQRLIVAFTPYMERRGHWEEWSVLLQRAIKLAQRVEDYERETTLTARLVRRWQSRSRPLETNNRYYFRVIQLAPQINNHFEEARACSNLGYHYIDGGRWWRSEVLSLHALAVFRELESEHGQAHTGLLYIRERKWEDAENHLQMACKIWQQMNVRSV